MLIRLVEVNYDQERQIEELKSTLRSADSLISQLELLDRSSQQTLSETNRLLAMKTKLAGELEKKVSQLEAKMLTINALKSVAEAKTEIANKEISRLQNRLFWRGFWSNVKWVGAMAIGAAGGFYLARR